MSSLDLSARPRGDGPLTFAPDIDGECDPEQVLLDAAGAVSLRPVEEGEHSDRGTDVLLAEYGLALEEGQYWDPEKHPRWPKGTPKAGQFIRVGERFELGGKEYDVEAVLPGKIHARVATKGKAQGAATIDLSEKQLAGMKRPEAEPVSAATNKASGTSASASGGTAGTATVIDAHAHPETHDPSIAIPAAAQGHVTPEQWKRFGKLDQERYSQLTERFGKWSPGKSSTLINQAYSQAEDANALSLVKSAYSNQVGASTGLTLGLHQVFKDVVGKLTGKPSPALEDARDRFERGRALMSEIASAVQWDLYNRTRAPDVALFHKHSAAGLFNEIVAGKRPVFSGLSMSQHYRQGWWSNGCFSADIAIRHIVMSSISGTYGLSGEKEVALADPYSVDPSRAMNWNDNNFASGKAKWLEGVTAQAASGEYLAMLRKSFDDPNFELPIPPSPPVIQMDSQGGKGYKDPPPQVYDLPKQWGTKTNAAGETVANLKWKDGNADGTPNPQPAQELVLQPGDFIQGNPGSPDKGTVYVILHDPTDSAMGVAYYKLTEPDGVTPNHSGQAHHFDNGGVTSFKKIDAHFDIAGWEKQQADAAGESTFNPQAWSEGVEKKLVSQLKQGDKFVVHGNPYEVVQPGSSTTTIKMLTTGEFGKINSDYKTPTLQLKDGYSESGLPTFDPGAYFAAGKQAKLASLGLHDGDVVVVGGKHHAVSAVTGGGSHATLTQLDGTSPGKVAKDAPLASIDGAKLTPKPLGWTAPAKGDTLAYGGKKATVTKILKDGTVQINTHPGVVKLAANDPALASLFSAEKHELGGKMKLRDFPQGAKFHAGTGQKLRPYVVLGPGEKGKVRVASLDTGEEMQLSAAKSYAQLAPKVFGTPEPDMTHSTPFDPSVVNLAAYEPHMDVAAEQLQVGDVLSKNGVFYKVDSVDGNGQVTNLSDGSQIEIGIQSAPTAKVSLYKLKGETPAASAEPGSLSKFSDMPVGTHFKTMDTGVPFGPMLVKTGPQDWKNLATGDEHSSSFMPTSEIEYGVVQPPSGESAPGTKQVFGSGLVDGDKFEWDGATYEVVDTNGTSDSFNAKNLATDEEEPFDKGYVYEKHDADSATTGKPRVAKASELAVGDHFLHDGEVFVVKEKSVTGGMTAEQLSNGEVLKSHPDWEYEKVPKPETFPTPHGQKTLAQMEPGEHYMSHGETYTVDKFVKTDATGKWLAVKQSAATHVHVTSDQGDDAYMALSANKYEMTGAPSDPELASGPPPALPATVYDPSAYVSVGQSKLADLEAGEIFVGAKNGKHYMVVKTGAKSGLTALDLQTGKKSAPWTYDKVAEHLMPKASSPFDDGFQPGDPVQVGKLKPGDQIKLSPGGKEQVYEIVSFGKGEAPQVKLAPVGPDLNLGAPGTAGTTPLSLVTFHSDAASAAAAKAQLAQAQLLGKVSAPAEVDTSLLPHAEVSPFSPKSKTGGGYHFTKAKFAGEGALLQDKNGNTFLVKQPGPQPVVSTGESHALLDGDHNLKVVSVPFSDQAGPLPGGSAQGAEAQLAESKLEPVFPGLNGMKPIHELDPQAGDLFKPFVQNGKMHGVWKVTSVDAPGQQSPAFLTAYNPESGITQTFGSSLYVTHYAKGQPAKTPGAPVNPSQLEVGDKFKTAGDTYEVVAASPSPSGKGSHLTLKNVASGQELPTSEWHDLAVLNKWEYAGGPDPSGPTFSAAAYQEGPQATVKDLKPGDVFKHGNWVAMVDSVGDGGTVFVHDEGGVKGLLPAQFAGTVTKLDPVGGAAPAWSEMPDAPGGFTLADAPVGGFVADGEELWSGSGVTPAVWKVLDKNGDGTVRMQLVTAPTGTAASHGVGHTDEFAGSTEFGKFQPPAGAAAPAEKVEAQTLPPGTWVDWEGSHVMIDAAKHPSPGSLYVADKGGNVFAIPSAQKVTPLPGAPGKPIETPPFDVYDPQALHSGPWLPTSHHLLIGSLPKGAVFKAPASWNYPDGQTMHVMGTDGATVSVVPPEGGDEFEVPFGQLGNSVTVMKQAQEEHPAAGWKTNGSGDGLVSKDEQAHIVSDFAPGVLVQGSGGTAFRVVSHDDEDKTTIEPVGNVSQGDAFANSGTLELGKPIQVSAYWKPSAYEAPTVGGWAFAGDLAVGDEFEDANGEKFTVADKDSEGVMADSVADPDEFEFTPFQHAEIVTPVFLNQAPRGSAGKSVEVAHGLVENTKGVTVDDLPKGAKFAGGGIVYEVAGPADSGGVNTKIVEHPGSPTSAGVGAWSASGFAPAWVPSGVGPKEPDAPVPPQLPDNTAGSPVGALQVGDHFQTEHGSVYEVSFKGASGVVQVKLVHGVPDDPVGSSGSFGPTYTPKGVQPGALAGAPAGKKPGDPVLPSQLQVGDYFQNQFGSVFKVVAHDAKGWNGEGADMELVKSGTGQQVPSSGWHDSWADGWSVADPSALEEPTGGAAPGESGTLQPFSPKSKTGGGYTFGKLGQIDSGSKFMDKSGAVFTKVGPGAHGMTAYADEAGTTFLAAGTHNVKLVQPAAQQVASLDPKDALAIAELGGWESVPAHPSEEMLFSTAQNDFMGGMAGTALSDLKPGDAFDADGGQARVVAQKGGFLYFKTEDGYYSVPVEGADGHFYAVKV